MALILVRNDIAIASESRPERSVILLLQSWTLQHWTLWISVVTFMPFSSIGITSTALDCFRSHLSSHTQFVNVNGSTSERHVVQFSIPKGRSVVIAHLTTK